MAELRVIGARRWVRGRLREAGWDLVRWPVAHRGYTVEAVLQQILAGVTHAVEAGSDGTWGRAVRDLGYSGAFVSFEPSPSEGLLAAAQADPRWDLHPVALGASPGSCRVGERRVPVARLGDRLGTVVPEGASLVLKLDTADDLAVLRGAEPVLARFRAVQTRGGPHDERLGWLAARGFVLRGTFPERGAWTHLLGR